MSHEHGKHDHSKLPRLPQERVGPNFHGTAIEGHTGAFEVSAVMEDGTTYICHSRYKPKPDDINLDQIPLIVKKIKKARKFYLRDR